MLQWKRACLNDLMLPGIIMLLAERNVACSVHNIKGGLLFKNATGTEILIDFEKLKSFEFNKTIKPFIKLILNRLAINPPQEYLGD